ncbi:MAG: hypothetical protein Q9209_003136 [Squamulea sp. 1 TL-2023]
MPFNNAVPYTAIDSGGPLVHQPTFSPRPYQHLTWQQPNAPAASHQSEPPADAKTAVDEHVQRIEELLLPVMKERAQQVSTTLTNISTYMLSVNRPRPSDGPPDTDHPIVLLSLAGARMRRDCGQDGASNTESDPASAELPQEPPFTIAHPVPGDQIPASRLAETIEWQRLSQGVPNYVSSGNAESDSSIDNNPKKPLPSQSNKTVKAGFAADAPINHGSDTSTASTHANV